MNGWLIAGGLENTSPRQWFVYGAMLLTVACALLRTVGNLIELRRLRRFGQRRAGYYAVRVWGASSGLVQIFLVAECFIVNALSVLLLLVLSDVTLW
ncbi:hypothetical protein [Cronobacter dublinensis]|uniref:hypothetical protein n=1 Tax=Cronobacter dublinensis TaxID=413497 RepID=UPI001D774422|nr:hypothetical protein [Cronobacter dublinensis subsp. dublinensis]ELY9424895.1 hypothetical protein [Cronobacter dublinensis]EGT5671088.1 hypothetical protein [Cronobacter dublinensis subsp. dublinensis]EGT5679801.1 hypothetical protein [Cronobacter dublinensis subsp. dublinensis]EGT5687979.1 hypothetical protein [Cronobacter dublinensis subsp. dublinensis]